MNKNMYKQLRSILCIALVVCYLAGLMCLFFGAAQAGIALWVVSTLGGIITLYFIREKEAKEAEQAENQNKQDGDDNKCE